jgi:hypothetical protein
MTAVYAGKGRAPGEAEACLFSRAAKSIGPTCNRKHVQPIDIVSRQGKVQKGKVPRAQHSGMLICGPLRGRG